MKRGLVLISLVLLVLFMSVFVSASFSDFWNKITGKATVACTDSDGLNYYVKGTTISGTNSFTDYCNQSTAYINLIEGYCGPNGILEVGYFCPNGCSNGACISSTTTTPAPSASQINIPSTSTLCYLGDFANFSCGNYVMNLSTIYRTTNGGTIGAGSRLAFTQISPVSSGNIYDATFMSNTSTEVNGTVIIGGITYGVHIEGIPSPNVNYSAIVDSSGSCSVKCPSHPTTFCTDTDGGINYNIKGTITNSYGENFTDWCSYPTILVEGFCDNATNRVTIGPYQCPTGQICSNGACISASSYLGSETNPWQMSATPIIMKYNQDAIFSCNCPIAVPIQLRIESVTGSNALFVDRFNGTGTYYYTKPPTTTTTDSTTGIVTVSTSVIVKGLEYPVEIITNKSDIQYGNFEQFPYNVLVKVFSPANCFTKFPDCVGKQCGGDGCGGSCGTCSRGTCTNGQCPTCKKIDESCTFDSYKQSDCCTDDLRCIPVTFVSAGKFLCQKCIASGERLPRSMMCCDGPTSSSLKWVTRQDPAFCCWANSWTDWGCWWNEKNCGTVTVNDHTVCK